MVESAIATIEIVPELGPQGHCSNPMLALLCKNLDCKPSSINHFFSKTLGVGIENNHVRSSISDQCYCYAKYDNNASTRACFF